MNMEAVIIRRIISVISQMEHRARMIAAAPVTRMSAEDDGAAAVQIVGNQLQLVESICRIIEQIKDMLGVVKTFSDDDVRVAKLLEVLSDSRERLEWASKVHFEIRSVTRCDNQVFGAAVMTPVGPALMAVPVSMN